MTVDSSNRKAGELTRQQKVAAQIESANAKLIGGGDRSAIRDIDFESTNNSNAMVHQPKLREEFQPRERQDRIDSTYSAMGKVPVMVD